MFREAGANNGAAPRGADLQRTRDRVGERMQTIQYIRVVQSILRVDNARDD